ncbi:hypothetical protein FE257_010306 [Aspergillus nanangensis]|uniref:Uncharacterized protein n=1 Tax=Aspergillus nanangensis TaxID=2582783 RepID=A0AAD4CIZ8_ASPNN|nr:hypothetical protein FE257_010306 [Aspergillus nanangensis]
MSDHDGSEGAQSPMNIDEDGKITPLHTSMANVGIEHTSSSPPAEENDTWWGPDVEWLLEREPENILDPAAKVREYQMLHRLGDYAGRLWYCLRKACHPDYVIDERVVLFRDKLTEESKDSLSSEQHSIKALSESVDFLQTRGYDVDLEMAKLAILVYSKRNVICHAKAGLRSIQTNSRLLNEAVNAEINSLQQILPDSQFRHYYETWQRLLRFYEVTKDGKIPGRNDDRAEAHRQSGNVSKTPDLRLLSTPARDRAFKKRSFDAEVQMSSRSPMDRKPHTPYRRTRSSVSDTVPYLVRKRSASGSPDPDGGSSGMHDNRTARPRHTRFVASSDAKREALFRALDDLRDCDEGLEASAL